MLTYVCLYKHARYSKSTVLVHLYKHAVLRAKLCGRDDHLGQVVKALLAAGANKEAALPVG